MGLSYDNDAAETTKHDSVNATNMPNDNGNFNDPTASATISNQQRISTTTDLKKQKIYMGSAEEFGNFRLKDNKLVRSTGGISWLLAALFLLADMAGGGIVAMPTAVVNASFHLGLVLMFLFAIMATISSVMLGKAWLILLRRYPEYRTHCRKPYAAMGYRALGPIMMHLSSACVNFTQFGASVVFLLLSAKNINDFLATATGVDIGYCLMILIIAILLMPIMLLKSPQDFWPAVIMGMISTLIAVALVVYGAWIDVGCRGTHPMPSLTINGTFVNMGTMLFSFGGHSAFPTIQHDMRRPADYDKSSYLGFGIITLINLIVVLFGALTYGGSLGSSVINSIQKVWVRQAINLMIAAHCLLTVTLIINPLNQEVEEVFKIPQGFGFKRIFVRTVMMALVVLTAETLPSFSNVMDLIGGSTVTLTSFVFPCIFYIFLSTGEKILNEKHYSQTNILKVNPDDENDDYEAEGELKLVRIADVLKKQHSITIIVCVLFCVIGLVGGTAATVYAIIGIYNDGFITPCYVKFFLAEETITTNKTVTVLNCCGLYQNVSLLGGVCSPKKL